MNILSDETMKELALMITDLTTEAINKALSDFRRLNRQKDYMSAKEACDYLGVSFNSLQKMREDGLKVVKSGTRTIYSKKAIEEYFNQKGQ